MDLVSGVLVPLQRDEVGHHKMADPPGGIGKGSARGCGTRGKWSPRPYWVT